MLRGITKGYEETTRYVGGLEGKKRDGEGWGLIRERDVMEG